MKRKKLKYTMFDKKKTTSKDIIALMEKLNDECNFLAEQAVNVENGFKPYPKLVVTKDNKVFGVVVTLEYRGTCDYCRASIELNDTVVGKPKIVTNEHGEKEIHLTQETYNLVYASKQHIMDMTGYNQNQIVPFNTYIAYTFDGIVMDQIGMCGYRKLDDNNVYVDGVEVSEDYRRCGIASALLDTMGKDIANNGFNCVQLDAITTKSACELYRGRDYMFDFETYVNDEGYRLLPLIKKVNPNLYKPKLKCPMQVFTGKDDVLTY